MLSSAGLAPLSPDFLKTVTTFAVFPSWMYLLGGDDNCMLSVPSSTCDTRISCWQGGDICQAIDPAAFTLFSYELRSSFNYGLPASRFPSFWPDTASFRSCLSLPPGFLSTREAGICAGSRACFTLLFLLGWFCYC